MVQDRAVALMAAAAIMATERKRESKTTKQLELLLQPLEYLQEASLGARQGKHDI